MSTAPDSSGILPGPSLGAELLPVRWAAGPTHLRRCRVRGSSAACSSSSSSPSASADEQLPLPGPSASPLAPASLPFVTC